MRGLIAFAVVVMLVGTVMADEWQPILTEVTVDENGEHTFELHPLTREEIEDRHYHDANIHEANVHNRLTSLGADSEYQCSAVKRSGWQYSVDVIAHAIIAILLVIVLSRQTQRSS